MQFSPLLAYLPKKLVLHSSIGLSQKGQYQLFFLSVMAGGCIL